MIKQIIYLFFTITIINACDDLFHEEDNAYIVLDKTQEKIDVINGIYALLNRVHNENYLTALARSDDINLYNNYYFNTESFTCSGSGGQVYDIVEITGSIYMNLYKAVINANSALFHCDINKEPQIAGELFFLRAYCYFKLARLFGTPPLVDDIDVDYHIKKPNYNEVFEFIESDLKNCLHLLPENSAKSRIPFETPNQQTAKALLAEVYLSWAGFPIKDETKYIEAAKYASEVIQNGEYMLFNDFADLWKEKNRHNQENIFGLFYIKSNSEPNYHFYQINQEQLNVMSNVHAYHNEVNGHSIIHYNGDYCPDFEFYINFPKNYRKRISLSLGRYTTIEIETIEGLMGGASFMEYNPLTQPCQYAGQAVSLKGFDVLENSKQLKSYKGSEVTLYLLRYAQTLLTYAEAKARMGELDESALNAVNMIRRRANELDIHASSKYDLPITLSNQQFIDSVIQERAWELCMEPEGRWFDIVRLDLKNDIMENHIEGDMIFKVDEEHLNEDWYFYKIPQEDRWLNPNLN